MQVAVPPLPSVRRRWLQAPVGVEFVLALSALSLFAAAIATRWDPSGATFLWNLDLPKIDYPLATLFHSALASGRLPLWNDALGLGFPLYAEGQIGAFYPPNWLIFQLPPLEALEVTRVVHLALAGTGAGLLALRIAGTRRGAVLAAGVAILGGAVTTKLEWTNVVVAWGWAPWVLLPLVRRPPMGIGLASAGIAWGVQALAGHPNTWLLTGLAAAVIVVANGREIRSILRVAAVFSIGAAIGAVQLVPTFVLLRLSARAGGLAADDLFNNSFTPFDPLGAAFVNAFVRAGPMGWDLSTSWYPYPNFGVLEAGVYVGLPVLALAAVGAGHPRARPWLVLAAAMVGLAVLGALRPALWASLPILNGIRHPARAYLFVSLAVGMLAAIGVSRPSMAGSFRRATAIVGVAVGLYAATVLVASNLPLAFEGFIRDIGWYVGPDRGAELRLNALAALGTGLPFAAEVALGIVTCAAVAAVRRDALQATCTAARTRLRPFIRLALVLLAIGPLAVLSPLVNGRLPADASDWSRTPFVSASASVGAHRLVALDPPGWFDGMPDQLAAAGVHDLRMFSSLDLAATDALIPLIGSGGGVPIRRAIGIDTLVTFGDQGCPGTFITYVEKDKATFCRDDAALHPPYWIPQDVARVNPADASALLPSPVDAEIDAVRALESARSARLIESGTGTLEAQVDAPADGWLYVDEAWWPTWQVAVDGRAVTPLRALGGMLIAVPIGSHDVTAHFYPVDAGIGAGIGLAGAVSAAILAIADIRRRRERDPLMNRPRVRTRSSLTRTRPVRVVLERPTTEGEFSGEQPKDKDRSDRERRTEARSRESAQHQEDGEDPKDVPGNADRPGERRETEQ